MKRIISVTLVMIIVSIFFVTGCVGNDNRVSISYNLGKGVITVKVPKNEDGTPKYEFSTKKPRGITGSSKFYLVTENAMIGFKTSSMNYNTSSKYKKKYGKQEATFDGYLTYIEDKEMFDKSYVPGLEKLEINKRKAIRYYDRTSEKKNYKYRGYFYKIAADDIYSGSKFDVVVNYKDTKNLPKTAKELDEETLEIIKSIELSKSTK